MFSNDRGTFAQHYAEQTNKDKQAPKTESELKGRKLADDPMLAYFREKEKEKQGADNGAKIYKDPYPPNRYNIRPGHRWDGVDRSNGHEKRLIERETQMKAREEDSYRTATRDM